MYKPTSIVISYFTANGRDWVGVYYTPYNPDYVREIRAVPTAHYDIGHPEDSNWTCEARYGDTVEALVKKHFPDIPLDIQERRGKDLYAKGD